MSKYITLKFLIINLWSNYSQQDLGSVEVEYIHHQLGHLEFGFQIMILLIALDKSGEGLGTVAIYLIFIDFKKMKSYVIGVSINGCCKEADVELHFGFC